MPDPIDPKDVDKRIAPRHVRTGALDEKAYDRYLKSLPDSAEKAAPVDTSMFENDDEEDDAEE
jgi:hypothetical protein